MTLRSRRANIETMADNYIFYKRKSSDSEDKQILSLDSQDRVIQESIPNFSKLNITADYEESMSAKAPGRPKFNQMCEKLESGKAQFIICWQLNRLARNPVDGGRIIWLVQNYGIKIITPSKTYDANDILLMYVEFAMSNQFITDLKKSTYRGIEDKLRAGIAPILAPIGYYNDVTKKQGLRDILPDPARFELVRKMWDLLLTGQYSVQKIWQIAANDWGLRQRNGGKPLSRSKIYEMFNNCFYAGKFKYQGEVYQGIHQRMITEEEFDRAQRILGSKGRPMEFTHQFAYTRLMKCVCGSGITAHERYRKVCPSCHYKYNAQKNDFCPKCKTDAPENTWYVCYYHCSKKYNPDCKQTYVKVDKIEEQIESILESIYLPEDFVNWTLKQLRKVHEEEISSRQIVDTSLSTTLISVQKKLDNLLSKYLSEVNTRGELISDEEYKHQKEILLSEKKHLEEQLQGQSQRQENWIDTAESVFHFASNARHWFNEGTMNQKRSIVSAVGLNLVLEDGLLRCDLLKPFELIQQGSEMLKNEAKMFEPKNSAIGTVQTSYSAHSNPFWGDRRDSNPQPSVPQTDALPLSYDHHDWYFISLSFISPV